MGADVPDEHLERRRGRQSRPAQHVRRGVGIEARDLVAHLGEAGRDAAQERGRAVLLIRLGGEVGELDGVHQKALGLEAELVVVTLGCHGDDVHIDRRREHASALVVGVVAAELGAAGGGEERDVAVLPEFLPEGEDRVHETLPIGGERLPRAGVHLRECFVKGAALERGDRLFLVHAVSPVPFHRRPAARGSCHIKREGKASYL